MTVLQELKLKKIKELKKKIKNQIIKKNADCRHINFLKHL